jgi:hypothetical protein
VTAKNLQVYVCYCSSDDVFTPQLCKKATN